MMEGGPIGLCREEMVDDRDLDGLNESSSISPCSCTGADEGTALSLSLLSCGIHTTWL